MSDLTSLPNLPQMQQDATPCRREKNQSLRLARILSHSQRLSQRQLNAIELLLQGLSDAQVAQQSGVDRTTIFRWRKEEKFAAELERQRKVVMQQSATRLQAMLEPALDILQRQITADDPKIALRAAAILLRVATPGRMQRMADPEGPAEKRTDRFMQDVEAYINAPIPGEEEGENDE